MTWPTEQEIAGLTIYSDTRAPTSGLNTAISNISTRLKEYIKAGGTNTSLVADIKRSTDELNQRLAAYNALITRMKESISGIRADSGINGKLATIAELQGQIEGKEREKVVLTEDKETAAARKRSVQRADKSVSYEQLVGGIKRPVHPISIPILITLSVVFAAITVGVTYSILVAHRGGSAAQGQSQAQTPLIPEGFGLSLGGSRRAAQRK
jgi:hypothetical protein